MRNIWMNYMETRSCFFLDGFSKYGPFEPFQLYYITIFIIRPSIINNNNRLVHLKLFSNTNTDQNSKHAISTHHNQFIEYKNQEYWKINPQYYLLK